LTLARLRPVLIWLAGLVVLSWWAPVFAVRQWLPGRVQERCACEVRIEQVLPHFPWGARVRGVTLTRERGTLAIQEASIWPRVASWRIEGQLAGGWLDARVRTDGSFGLVYFKGVDLEPLVRGWTGLPARGRAHGLVRWSDAVEVSAHADEASVVTPFGTLDLDRIDVLGARDSQGRFQIVELYGAGPSGRFSLRGSLDPVRDLEVALRLDRVADPWLRVMESLGVRPSRIPVVLELSGPTSAPRVVERMPTQG